MAALDTSRASLAPRGTFAPIAFLVSAIATWNDKRQTRNALSKLTDRELADIGLCRGDIDDVAQDTTFG